ncbi:MAG: Gfo/Idh/MocA family oxidoreductase [Bacteroidales bacterium]|nr:Gfo/Idh/MocA family oxidoreductase [Bacteroidales bacterium]
MLQQVEIAVIGVGNRARKYLSCLPQGIKVKYLVEPDLVRLGLGSKRYGVPAENCYASAEAFFAAPVELDAVIVAAPDKLHVSLATKAVQRGWHVLVEKPVAASEEEYMRLLEAADASGVQVGVCLEMRFYPFFKRIKEICRTGLLGQILEIEHTEHIGPDRMAHTFVRGLWSRKDETGPIFLSKCCHDADFILWLTGADVLDVKGSGSLSKFRHDPSAPFYCIDCKKRTCPYSAVRLYRDRREWISGFDVPAGLTLGDVIDAELHGGRYGRCVYHCDNDVYDVQDVEATLSGGIKLKMSLEGVSDLEGRSVVIRGSEATLEADRTRIRVVTTREGAPGADGEEALPAGTVLIDEDYSSIVALPLHAGADRALVEDFFDAIASGRTPAASLASAMPAHKLCWLAG